MSIQNQTVQELITSAFRVATLVNEFQTPSTARLKVGQDLLGGIVRQLHSEGLLARVQTTTLVTLAANTTSYALEDTVLDVYAEGKFIDASATDVEHSDGETAVLPMSREEWQLNGARSATGQPAKYWFDTSSGTATVYFWPMPGATENGAHVRLQVERYRGDVTALASNLDFEPYWVQYLKFALAEELTYAYGASLNRATIFAQKAEALKEKAKGKAHQRPRQQVYVDHPVANNWRHHG